MSSIVDKAFDATQKIMRTIFRGTPNLFTTPDLNRQIEAFDYRLKRLEWFRGIETDMVVSREVGAGYNNIVFTYSYIRVFGCTLYEGVQRSVYHSVYSGYPLGGYGLYINPGIVQYADDPSHAISGAKFADGTSQPAADNLVINDWGFALLQTSIWDNYFDAPDKFIIAETGTVEVEYMNTGIGNVPDGSYFIPLLAKDVETNALYPLFNTQHNITDTIRWNHLIKKTWTITQVYHQYHFDLTYNKYFGHLRITFQFESNVQSTGAEMITGVSLPPEIFPITGDVIRVPLVVAVARQNDGSVQPEYSAGYGYGFTEMIPDTATGTFKFRFNRYYNASTAGMDTLWVMCSCDIFVGKGTPFGGVLE